MTNFHKAPKELAVYTESDKKRGLYICRDCMMFIPDRYECTMVSGTIDECGGCNFYVPGKSATIEQINPHRLDTCQSGYVTSSDGFSCKRCRHFVKPDNCLRVEGNIDPNGCCNVWEEKNDGIESRTEIISRGLKS